MGRRRARNPSPPPSIPVLIDTNLLILYVVGACDPTLVAKCKRTEKYSTDDFALLDEVVERFPRVVTLPNVLTEVSNFLGHETGPRKSMLFQTFSECISRFDEQYVPSAGLAEVPHFNDFGLTDLAIKQIAGDGCLVLTDDQRLRSYLMQFGIDVRDLAGLRSDPTAT